MEPHYYEVSLDWTADRKGRMYAPQIEEQFHVATPLPFAQGVEGFWSPEHLFTAAVSSCFMTTFLAIADNSKLSFKSLHVRTKGKLDQIDGKYLMTEVIVEPDLVITNEADFSKAERILHKAEAACLISNSILSKRTLIPKVTW
jgi:peroxiredoxin-like protein